MGESTDSRTTLRFDRRVRLEFHGSTITSDAGLLACRELDDAPGLTETATACLQESRGGRNVQHQLVALVRQSVYSRLAMPPAVPVRGGKTVAMRTPTTLNGWPRTQLCGSSLDGEALRDRQQAPTR